MQLVYLDCDPGVDDALALGYLLAYPDVEILLIGTVSGNVSAAEGARNTLDLLQLLGRPGIQVAVGAHDYLASPYVEPAAVVHGDNGLGGVQLPTSAAQPVEQSAAEALVDLVRSRPGEIRVLAIGPLTNLALALDLEPELPRLVRDVVVMGGAALAPGNITAAAEANIYHDPEAAQRVMSADWDVILVPLDATMTQRFTADDIDLLRESALPAAQALGEMVEWYADFYMPKLGARSAVLHDPLAAGVLTGEAIPTRMVRAEVEVDTSWGPARGRTFADLRGIYHPQPADADRGVRIVLDVAEPFNGTLRDRLLLS